MTQYSALEVATWARASIEALRPRFESETKMYERLAKTARLSRTHVSQFARNPEYNITVSRLDRLVAAIKILTNENEETA